MFPTFVGFECKDLVLAWTVLSYVGDWKAECSEMNALHWIQAPVRITEQQPHFTSPKWSTEPRRIAHDGDRYDITTPSPAAETHMLRISGDEFCSRPSMRLHDLRTVE